MQEKHSNLKPEWHFSGAQPRWIGEGIFLSFSTTNGKLKHFIRAEGTKAYYEEFTLKI